MSPRWRKVLRDLWGNKTRTVLVVLSIGVGVFALGMIMGTNAMLGNDLPAAYNRIDPPHAVLFPDHFDSDLLPIVAEVEGVEAVTGRREFGVRWEESPGEWGEIRITFFADFDDMPINKIFPVEGAWPPPAESLLLERSALAFINSSREVPLVFGDKILIETDAGKKREVTIVGTAHDLNIPPVQFTNQPTAYAQMEMLDWLGIERLFDELYIRVTNDTEGLHPSEDHVREVAHAVRNKVERGGREVRWIWQPTPGEHPAEESINPLLYILGVLGGFSLFLSGFLVVNIISGLLTQHVRQIGIMKSIGAKSQQIFAMYIITVIIFGLLSLLVAVPLGGLAAYGFASYLAGLINFDLSGFYIPTNVWVTQLLVALGVPILASLVPVIKGARVSVREAISDQGGGKGQFGTHFLDRAMNWFTVSALKLSRPMSISLRNTIRRKARLILTIFTLTLGGAVFISIISVYDSLIATMEDALSYFSYDVDLDFNKSHRIEEIYQTAYMLDEVDWAESWIGRTTRRVKANGDEGENLVLLGVPPDTEVINPEITEGRWVTAEDTNGIVINTAVQQREEDLQLGDTLVLKLDGEESEWLIVGIAQSVMVGPLMYGNQAFIERHINQVSRSSGVRIIANGELSATAQHELGLKLEEHFNAQGLAVGGFDTTGQTREEIRSQFQIIVSFMAVMAILIALVGGLGLMGTMSINVLERTREIGVMRAVGASDRSVLRIVMVEGLFIGFVSWVVSAVLSYPIGRWLSNTVGITMLQSPLNYQFSWMGAIGWVVAILLIALLASLLPARSASRLSVRETLAYE